MFKHFFSVGVEDEKEQNFEAVRTVIYLLFSLFSSKYTGFFSGSYLMTFIV